MYTDLIQQFIVEAGPNISKDQGFVLLVHAYMLSNNYTETSNQVNLIKTQSDLFKLSYKKDKLTNDVTIKKKSDDKYEFVLSNPNRKVNVVIDSKKYLTNLKSISEANETTAKPLNTFLDSIVRTNYTSPLQFQQPEPHPFTNPNPMTNNPQPSFIHGINDFGPFPPNTQIPFPYQPMPMNGNLVGPDNFIFRQPHPQVRYDPMSPFGSGFDFIPPQDGIGGNGFGAGGII